MTRTRRKRKALPQALAPQIRRVLKCLSCERRRSGSSRGNSKHRHLDCRPEAIFLVSNKTVREARKGLRGQMQNISCPIWHGNASGLAQQELEDETEENDVPLALVCCKWGTTLEENGLIYGEAIYVHNSSKHCLSSSSIFKLDRETVNNEGSLNVQKKKEIWL